MIKSVYIKGFKGFNEIEFGMSRVTLLGGRNNIGKTSILEALFMFFDRFNPNVILRQLAARNIPATILDPESAWAPIFHNLDIGNEIQISATYHDKRKETMIIKFNPNYTGMSIPIEAMLSENGVPVIKTDKKPTESYSLDFIYRTENHNNEDVVHLRMGPQGMGMDIKSLRVPNIPATILDARTKNNPNDDAFRFGRLDVLGKAGMVLDAMRIIEPGLKDLSVVPNGIFSLVYGDIGMGQKIPVALMGDGMSRLLSLAVALNTNRSGFVFIDEIESGFHYSVLPRIWRMVAETALKLDVQVIATTHSNDVLRAAVDSFSDDMEKEFTFVRLEKNKKNNNAISARTFKYDTLKVAMEREWEVR